MNKDMKEIEKIQKRQNKGIKIFTKYKLKDRQK